MTGGADATAPVAGQRRTEMKRALDTAVGVAPAGTGTSPGAMAVAPGFVDLGAGLIEVPSATRGAWTVQCTGTTWPAALQTAALEWAAHLYDSQRRALSSNPDEDLPAPSYALPNRVSEMLTPYLLP